MHISTSPYTFSLTSSNLAQVMQPPISPNTTTTMHPSADQRARLYSLINGLADDQLRSFLTNHLQSISNTTFNNNQFQHYSRTQLLQQSFILVDNYFSADLEKALYAMRQKPLSNDYRQQQQQQQQQQQHQQQQQQQQQQVYRAPAAELCSSLQSYALLLYSTIRTIQYPTKLSFFYSTGCSSTIATE